MNSSSSEPTDTAFSWIYRRRAIWLSLGFCAFWISYLIVFGDKDSKLHETIADSLIWGGFGVVAGYCFSASWENLGWLKKKNNSGGMGDL